MDRRDFVKLALLLPFLPLTGRPDGRRRGAGLPTLHDGERPHNVIIVIFDSLAAANVSLYGYQRETMPNLARFAQRATVYHAHQSAGNYTTPGTASLLTGLYPWTHRAINLGATAAADQAKNNLFAAFDPTVYDRIAYTQNPLVSYLFHQFRNDLDCVLPPGELSVLYDQFSEALRIPDHNAAYRAESRLFRPTYWRWQPSSLFLSLLDKGARQALKSEIQERYGSQFPKGLPNHNGSQYFLIEHSIDRLIGLVREASRPFLAYVHLWPPHHPYNTRREFIGKFNDGWSPAGKPPHHFSMQYRNRRLNEWRREYDEYLAYVDAEFGRFFDYLVESGAIDNNYVVFTSDHGEMFERGIFQHLTPTLYDPVVRVPLLISQPGQVERRDIYSATSAVDLVPTLTHLTGQPIPAWAEGKVLPPFGEAAGADPSRSVFVVEAKRSAKLAPLSMGTAALVKGPLKLVHYFGYEDLPNAYELFNLEDDPQEMNDLFREGSSQASRLRQELQDAMHSAESRLGGG